MTGAWDIAPLRFSPGELALLDSVPRLPLTVEDVMAMWPNIDPVKFAMRTCSFYDEIAEYRAEVLRDLYREPN